MDKINKEAEFQEEILELEMKKAKEGKRLTEEHHTSYERFKPAAIVKNIFRESVKSPEVRSYVIDKTVDVALILLTNIILRKMTDSFVKRTVGTVLVWGIKNIVSRNPGIIKKAGTGILNRINHIITKRNRNKEYAYSSQL